LCLFISSLLVTSCSTRPSKPNIVLIVIDTLRQDHLGCYGYHRNTSPNIDSLAASGIVFKNVQAQSSWTLPAMASMMTGLSHRVHGTGFWDGAFFGLDPSLPTLPTIMAGYGYQTAAFFNVVFLSPEFGFHRGFQFYSCESSVEEGLVRDAEGTVNDIIHWLNTDRGGGYDPDKPLFLVIHLYDPHLKYSPPAPFDTLFANPGYSGTYNADWGGKVATAPVNCGSEVPDSTDIANLEALYDGEIAFVDRNIGRLVTALREHDLTSNTWFIVTADHGEEFYEHHGVGHGHTLYQELLAIPLIITGPGLDPDTETEAVAAQIDVLPTVLSICGLDVPEWAEGQNLLSPDRNVSARDVFSSLVTSFGPWVAVRRGSMKLHWQQCDDASMQFNLDSDPLETSMLDEVDSSLVESALWYWATPPAGHPEPADMDQAMINALRGLGYL